MTPAGQNFPTKAHMSRRHKVMPWGNPPAGHKIQHRVQVTRCHLDDKKWVPSVIRDMTWWNNGQDLGNHLDLMGGGTHRQTEYSLIMIFPLKQGYKLRRRGKDQRLEQNWGERYMRESENTIWGSLRSCSNLKCNLFFHQPL